MGFLKQQRGSEVTKIKMSEVFELPVKKTQGGVLPFLKDCNPMSNTIFVGNDDHVDASVIAINAYDANQQEISELKAMVNVLRRAADLYHGGYKASELEEAAAIMNMSPKQCLQSEKADAIDEAADCILGVHDGDTCFDILNEIAKKLREGKS